MRATPVVPVALALMSPLAPGLDGQMVRRPEPRAFRFSVTPYAGLGGGGTRALATDSAICAAVQCVSHRLGSSAVIGLEVHVPLPGTIALGFAVAGGRPNRVACLGRGSCDSRGRVTAVRASTLLLWRFKRRAPMYLGFGPALAYASPGPVYTQPSATTELGGLVVAAYDARVTSAVGLRGAWWNYFLAPVGSNLPMNATPKDVVWESQVTFGVAVSFGSPTTRRPPRTLVPEEGYSYMDSLACTGSAIVKAEPPQTSSSRPAHRGRRGHQPRRQLSELGGHVRLRHQLGVRPQSAAVQLQVVLRKPLGTPLVKRP